MDDQFYLNRGRDTLTRAVVHNIMVSRWTKMSHPPWASVRSDRYIEWSNPWHRIRRRRFANCTDVQFSGISSHQLAGVSGNSNPNFVNRGLAWSSLSWQPTPEWGRSPFSTSKAFVWNICVRAERDITKRKFTNFLEGPVKTLYNLARQLEIPLPMPNTWILNLLLSGKNKWECK
jgi:hypothetical protein